MDATLKVSSLFRLSGCRIQPMFYPQVALQPFCDSNRSPCTHSTWLERCRTLFEILRYGTSTSIWCFGHDFSLILSVWKDPPGTSAHGRTHQDYIWLSCADQDVPNPIQLTLGVQDINLMLRSSIPRWGSNFALIPWIGNCHSRDLRRSTLTCWHL